MIVWLDGELRSSDGALGAQDRGFLMGDGAFETLLSAGGDPLFLSPHLERLARGLEALEIDARLDAQGVRRACRNLARANRVVGAGVLRITVSRGVGGRGPAVAGDIRPTRLMALENLDAQPAVATAIVARQRRFTMASTATYKSIGGYADNLAARAEARSRGADEAFMLNEFGRLAGAAFANAFLISPAGEVTTPPETDGALPGVVRALLISGVPEHGVAIAECGARAEDLERSSAFITNSLTGPRRVAGLWPGAAQEAFARLETWYQCRLAEERRTAGTEP
jgi:branched-chain amino acid aminotransferase